MKALQELEHEKQEKVESQSAQQALETQLESANKLLEQRAAVDGIYIQNYSINIRMCSFYTVGLQQNIHHY